MDEPVILFREVVAANLRALRVRAGWTAADMAAALMVDEDIVLGMEDGRLPIDFAFVPIICDQLKINLRSFVEGIDQHDMTALDL